MLFTLGITIVWKLLNLTHGSNLSIAAFAITGYSSLLLWRNCSNRSVKSIEVNHALLYHRNVRVFDVFTARLMLEIAGATASTIALTIYIQCDGLDGSAGRHPHRDFWDGCYRPGLHFHSAW